MAFHWTCSRKSMSFVLGSPKLDTTFQMSDQCWIEGKNHLPPATGDAFANVAQILLASFATRACYWLKCNLLFTVTCKAFPAKLLSSQSSPSMYWCLGLFLPSCRALHFPLFNFMSLLSSHFSHLLRSLWMAAQLSTTPNFLPSARIG